MCQRLALKGKSLFGFSNWTLMKPLPLDRDDAASSVEQKRSAQARRLSLTPHELTLASARLCHTALTSISQGVLITDADRRIMSVNPAFEAMTGYAMDELVGGTCAVLQGVDTCIETVRQMRVALRSAKPFNGELLNYRKDGTTFWNELSINPVIDTDGVLTNFVGVQRNVTERKNSNERIDWLSHFDLLTGVSNRTLLRQRCTRDIGIAKANGSSVAMIILGVDHFKTVNDSYGHITGDEVLKQLAERLATVLSEHDTLARIGGDEFVLTLPAGTVDSAHKLAVNLLSLAAVPYLIAHVEVIVTASIGIAIHPQHGEDFEDLFKAADLALNRAKQLGRRQHQFFCSELLENAMVEVRLVAELRVAISRKQLELHYQPFVDLRTGQIDGMEVLLRWNHPELGVVSPSRFIPAAEKSGLILQIGTWVFSQACRDIRDWLDQGIAVPPVSVNFSPLQLRNAGLVHEIRSTLAQYAIDPCQLCIEVTEGALIQDVQYTEALLRDLKSLGLGLSLDDFGTGYSSLSYLKLFPFDKVKIDQSFVRGLIENPPDAVIAKVIISMAHGLGLQVIAEGVETKAQSDFMRANGCDQIQGYLFSRPLPKEQMELTLRTRRYGTSLSCEEEFKRPIR